MRVEHESFARGVDVLVGIGVSLLILEGLAMGLAAIIIAPRFGASVEWLHPQLAIPLAIMVVTTGLAIEAIARRRSETAMVIHAVTTVLTFVGVPGYFALLVFEIFASV